MKTGIIGLPKIGKAMGRTMGKTSLLKTVTKADIARRGHFTPREAHFGTAKLAASGKAALKETAFLPRPQQRMHAA